MRRAILMSALAEFAIQNFGRHSFRVNLNRCRFNYERGGRFAVNTVLIKCDVTCLSGLLRNKSMNAKTTEECVRGVGSWLIA